MSYLFSVDHNGMEVHPTRNDCEVFKKCCISNAMGRTDDDILSNDSEENGDVRSQYETDAGTECEDSGTECEDGDSDTDW